MLCATQSKATFLLLQNIQSWQKLCEHGTQSSKVQRYLKSSHWNQKRSVEKNNPTYPCTKTWTRTDCLCSSREATGCMHSRSKHSSTRLTISFVFCLFLCITITNSHYITKEKNNTLTDRNVDAKQQWGKKNNQSDYLITQPFLVKLSSGYLLFTFSQQRAPFLVLFSTLISGRNKKSLLTCGEFSSPRHTILVFISFISQRGSNGNSETP